MISAEGFRLSAKARRSYERNGFYVTPLPVIPKTTILSARSAARRFVRALSSDRISLPNGAEYRIGWSPSLGDKHLKKVEYVGLLVDEIRRLTLHRAIGTIASQLCGQPVRLWHDEYFDKPPAPANEVSGVVGWHQDSTYWGSCSSDNMLTAWVPLVEITSENGGILFASGSHKSDNLEGLTFFEQDLRRQETLIKERGHRFRIIRPTLSLGQITFHHGRLLHASAINQTTRTRPAMAVHLQPVSNHYVTRYAGQQRLTHAHDFLARRVRGKPDFSDSSLFPALPFDARFLRDADEKTTSRRPSGS